MCILLDDSFERCPIRYLLARRPQLHTPADIRNRLTGRSRPADCAHIDHDDLDVPHASTCVRERGHLDLSPKHLNRTERRSCAHRLRACEWEADTRVDSGQAHDYALLAEVIREGVTGPRGIGAEKGQHGLDDLQRRDVRRGEVGGVRVLQPKVFDGRGRRGEEGRGECEEGDDGVYIEVGGGYSVRVAGSCGREAAG